MIKAVIFDCFGVLTTDKWVEFCATLPKGDVLDGARRLNHQYDAGKLGLEDFLDKVQQISGRDRQTIEKIITDPESVKNTNLMEYIKDLKKTHKIGILSNVATNWVRDSFLSPEEQKFFAGMVFSYEVGATKPDPLMYETVLTKLSVKPEEAVFIDDQPRYCEGAKAVDMQAIWYQNFEQMKAELENILVAADN